MGKLKEKGAGELPRSDGAAPVVVIAHGFAGSHRE